MQSARLALTDRQLLVTPCCIEIAALGFHSGFVEPFPCPRTLDGYPPVRREKANSYQLLFDSTSRTVFRWSGVAFAPLLEV
jgi:hypothetical protein